jgi:hypothetical protein
MRTPAVVAVAVFTMMLVFAGIARIQNERMALGLGDELTALVRQSTADRNQD